MHQSHLDCNAFLGGISKNYGTNYILSDSDYVVIEADEQNLDCLNYLAGQHVDHCNHMAQLGTKLAHIDGGVPQLEVSIENISAYNLGSLFYFFEFSCGVSAYVLGVNPFNQPGVEAYKKNMFALLGKPGFEAETKAIHERLGK